MSRERMITVNRRLANVTRCPYDEHKTAPFVNCLKKVNPHLLAGRILKTFVSFTYCPKKCFSMVITVDVVGLGLGLSASSTDWSRCREARSWGLHYGAP